MTAIFDTKETSTFQLLNNYGFSKSIIQTFFKPFFSGIFLEPNLETSSRMFEFVYKMFGAGFASLPKAGIEAIPKQLKARLKNTEFLFNSEVANVESGKIVLTDGTEIKSHFTIIATAPRQMISNLKNQDTSWKSCDTLYFEVERRVISKPLIGLICDDNSLINNIFYHTSIATASPTQQQLLSVTIVKQHNLSQQELQKKVEGELASLCDINATRFLKRYKKRYALPNLNNIQYDLAPSETKIKDTIFLAGDHLLNASLNAAMLSGERAAQGLVEAIEDSRI